ncbi:zinc finger protein 226 [Drosophila sulfurigaster albostrigata]|uniref:zinc finger protein 226 n=1 Tax=Drosophila sulfurigaster albostrigata TaxID=89887 RepID=UPI002D218974|nr:zinc finger protein 226 [Drosophila sulfurigaster albostrigata]
MAAAADAARSNALLAMNKANNTKCRACLSVSRQTVKLDAKIPDLQSVRTYGQGLRQCTNLPMTARSAGGYKWPMQICIRCCRALEVAMHFMELAVDSNRKLFAESQNVKLTPPHTPSMPSTGELKRKASVELLHWNQFSQEFEQFVESYDGISAPIEENVLYMRGAKVPRLDTDATPSNEPPKEDDVILFDVKYESNDQDQEDENDGSDAKNSETFYDNSITNDATNKNNENNNNNNNNNFNFNNKNDLPDDLIQRALFMTLNDVDVTRNQTPEELQTIESIKATLLESTEQLLPNKENSTTMLSQKSTPSREINPAHIPLLSCHICKHTAMEAKQMRSHYMRVHNSDVSEDDIIGLTKNQSFKCRPCNSYETNSRTDMQQHLIEHHKIDGDFEMYCYVQQNCPACGRIFKDQRSARTHYTRMHTPQQQPQSQAGVSCAGREGAEQQHMCIACDKVFSSKASLQAHQRFCQVKQPVHCNFCEQQFSSMRKYEMHLQQQHAVDTLHECEICKKSFKNSESLSVHRKRHSERHYQCGKCSLNYINAAELRVHYERAHVQEEEVVSCRNCGSKFQNYALLREHEQRNHQKAKVWRCDSCTFETSTRARLRQHQYEHTDYPYKCQHCPEEFADRGKIRQHSKKVHAVELTDEQLAEMFRERIGYTNRHDAFNKTNNSLEIPGFSDDCYTELKSLGLDYDDITTDLFSNSISVLDNLLELVP